MTWHEWLKEQDERTTAKFFLMLYESVFSADDKLIRNIIKEVRTNNFEYEYDNEKFSNMRIQGVEMILNEDTDSEVVSYLISDEFDADFPEELKELETVTDTLARVVNETKKGGAVC